MTPLRLRALYTLTSLLLASSAYAENYVTIQVGASAPASKDLGLVDVRVNEPSKREVEALKKNQRLKKSAFEGSLPSPSTQVSARPDIPLLTGVGGSSASQSATPAVQTPSSPMPPGPVPVFTTMKAASAAGINPFSHAQASAPAVTQKPSAPEFTGWQAWLVQNKETVLRYGAALAIAVVAATYYMKKAHASDEG